MPTYFAYLLRCADGTYYAGICTDLDRRLKEHNGQASGARYTRPRRPVVLAYSEPCANRSAALKREHALKRLSHAEKEALAASPSRCP